MSDDTQDFLEQQQAEGETAPVYTCDIASGWTSVCGRPATLLKIIRHLASSNTVCFCCHGCYFGYDHPTSSFVRISEADPEDLHIALSRKHKRTNLVSRTFSEADKF